MPLALDYDDEEYVPSGSIPTRLLPQQVIELRDGWLGRFGRGEFLDDTPLVAVENAKAKAYRLKDGSLLVAAVPIDPEKRWRFEAAAEFGKAHLYDFDHTASPVCPDCAGAPSLPNSPGLL